MMSLSCLTSGHFLFFFNTYFDTLLPSRKKQQQQVQCHELPLAQNTNDLLRKKIKGAFTTQHKFGRLGRIIKSCNLCIIQKNQLSLSCHSSYTADFRVT